MNCWEFLKCGREPGGERAAEGVCPAAACTAASGAHYGLNAGRACWGIHGTMCEGKVDGGWEEKMAVCTRCEFYLQVHREEADNLLSIDDIRRLVYAVDGVVPVRKAKRPRACRACAAPQPSA